MKCYSKSLPPVSFQFLAARCRCPWATLTPRSHSGQPRRIHAFRRSTPIQPRRVESMPMGTSRYFVRKTTIPPPKRPRRIHVSPCHDTPILFGDEVKRCPWGHLGNIMRTSYIPPPLGLEESMSAHAWHAHSSRPLSNFCPRTAEKTPTLLYRRHPNASKN